MRTSIVAQPQVQLGAEITHLLRTQRLEDIVMVSAFVGLGTILRLREDLLGQVARGCSLRLIVGIDLGGTSRDVLDELLRWPCEVFVYHNAIPRSTFHPKMYLFRGRTAATLFIGSNNLTDGGLYTNYELATRHDFVFPADRQDFDAMAASLASFTQPSGINVQRLTADLIQALVAHHVLPTEAQARQRGDQGAALPIAPGTPPYPFGPVAVPMPPLLPVGLRDTVPVPTRVTLPAAATAAVAPRPSGVLVWSKVLPASDALQVGPGTKHVGGVRLTQARSEEVLGGAIDQTSYFRQLFNDYHWETETGRNRRADQEHAFVPMRFIVRGQDFGVHDFEISHKPSGEAGQANYTTILRWGKDLTPIIKANHLEGTTLNLYETSDPAVRFLIDIV